MGHNQEVSEHNSRNAQVEGEMTIQYQPYTKKYRQLRNADLKK